VTKSDSQQNCFQLCFLYHLNWKGIVLGSLGSLNPEIVTVRLCHHIMGIVVPPSTAWYSQTRGNGWIRRRIETVLYMKTWVVFFLLFPYHDQMDLFPDIKGDSEEKIQLPPGSNIQSAAAVNRGFHLPSWMPKSTSPLRIRYYTWFQRPANVIEFHTFDLKYNEKKFVFLLWFFVEALVCVPFSFPPSFFLPFFFLFDFLIFWFVLFFCFLFLPSPLSSPPFFVC